MKRNKYDEIVEIVKASYIKNSEPITISEISKRLDIPKRTIYRLINMAGKEDREIYLNKGYIFLSENVWPYQLCLEFYLKNCKKIGNRHYRVLEDDVIFNRAAILIGILAKRNKTVGDILCYVKQSLNGGKMKGSNAKKLRRKESNIAGRTQRIKKPKR